MTTATKRWSCAPATADIAKLKREGGAPARRKRWRERLPWRRKAPVKAAPEPAR